MKNYPLLFALMLCGCVTPPLATRQVATVHASMWQAGDKGFFFNDENKGTLVQAGVPVGWFFLTARGWYLTEQQEEAAAAIVLRRDNPSQ